MGEAEHAPRTLGRYELLFPIGSGAMATVWAARALGDAGFAKLVAVKCMFPDLAGDPAFRTMFLDEARVASHVNSPHVAATHDLGQADDGTLFIAMELVIGVSVAGLLNALDADGARMPLPIALAIILDTAEGLHDAHEAKTIDGRPLDIVHRDVSPQNVLVGVDGRARLTDFGVARAMLRATRTATGLIKGKAAYCSPEQTLAIELDRRSDLFSLGAVAWEMIAGARLFSAEHPLATIRKITEMPVPSLSSVRFDVDGAIDLVIQTALARERDERPATAKDFANALAGAAREAGVEIADRATAGEYVQKAGGDRLRELTGRIQSRRVARIDEPSGSTVLVREPIGWARDGVATERLGAGRPSFIPDEHVRSVPPSAIITPSPPREPRRVPWLAIAVVALSAIVVAVVFGWPEDRERDEPAPAAAPASEATPDVVRDAGTATGADTSTETDTDPNTGAGTGTMETDTEPDPDTDTVTETGSDTSARDRRRRRRDRRRDPSAGPARMGMRGLDAFERDLMR